MLKLQQGTATTTPLNQSFRRCGACGRGYFFNHLASDATECPTCGEVYRPELARHSR